MSKDKCYFCGEVRDEHIGGKCPDVSESSLNELLCADVIATQLYPEEMVEVGGVAGFRADNNAGKRAVAKEVAQYFINIREGCMHNHFLGLCEKCLGEVDKF